jgi:hypothetical protein
VDAPRTDARPEKLLRQLPGKPEIVYWNRTEQIEGFGRF